MTTGRVGPSMRASGSEDSDMDKGLCILVMALSSKATGSWAGLRDMASLHTQKETYMRDNG